MGAILPPDRHLEQGSEAEGAPSPKNAQNTPQPGNSKGGVRNAGVS
jgi:hypothetical protein